MKVPAESRQHLIISLQLLRTAQLSPGGAPARYAVLRPRRPADRQGGWLSLRQTSPRSRSPLSLFHQNFFFFFSAANLTTPGYNHSPILQPPCLLCVPSPNPFGPILKPAVVCQQSAQARRSRAQTVTGVEEPMVISVFLHTPQCPPQHTSFFLHTSLTSVHHNTLHSSCTHP